MKQRLNPFKAAPRYMRTLLALSDQIDDGDIDPSLGELVKTRASQINRCAYCIHLHSTGARMQGEAEERLYLLDAWRDSPLYSDRERAALAWTEALTSVAETHAPDAVYGEVCKHFSDSELVQLTLMITTVNAWNRIAVGFGFLHSTNDGSPERATRRAS